MSFPNAQGTVVLYDGIKYNLFLGKRKHHLQSFHKNVCIWNTTVQYKFKMLLS